MCIKITGNILSLHGLKIHTSKSSTKSNCIFSNFTVVLFVMAVYGKNTFLAAGHFFIAVLQLTTGAHWQCAQVITLLNFKFIFYCHKQSYTAE